MLCFQTIACAMLETPRSLPRNVGKEAVDSGILAFRACRPDSHTVRQGCRKFEHGVLESYEAVSTRIIALRKSRKPQHPAER